MDLKVSRDGVVKFFYPVFGVVTSRAWRDFSFLKSSKLSILAYTKEEYPHLGSLLFTLGISRNGMTNILRPSLTHGSDVAFIGPDSEKHHNSGLIMVTPGDGILFQGPSKKTKRTVLLSLAADCPGAVLTAKHKSSKQQCFGILHLGWRSLVQGVGIIDNAVKMLKRRGFSVKECQVLITVGIGPCCFAVKEDVLSIFKELLPFSEYPSVYGITQNKYPQASIDLRRAAFFLFRRAGVPQRAIKIMPGCTCCSRGNAVRGLRKHQSGYLWPSYRRDRTGERFAIAFAV